MNKVTDCPNCFNSSKCYGPHLQKKCRGLYTCDDGYFILDESKRQYNFIPNEKEYNSQKLLDISNTLSILNEYQRYQI